MKKRKLLLDSCVAKAVADRVRADGHDVASVAERGADPDDPAVLDVREVNERAWQERRAELEGKPPIPPLWPQARA